MKAMRSFCAYLLLIALPFSSAMADRIHEVRARGALHCGIWPHVPGFAVDLDGRYVGFDVDTCRAIAAAILGDATKVNFIPLAHVREFAGRGDIDLVVRRLTWTPPREHRSATIFGPVTYYDGQGFLVPRSGAIRTASQLAGQRVCVIDAERHPATLHNHFRDQGLEIQMVLVDSDAAAERALIGNRCRAYSADISWLAAARSRFDDGRARYEILSDVISKEPLAPLLRAQDAELAALVRWTIYALIEAEELGLDSGNIDSSAPRSSRQHSFMKIHPGSDVALGAGDWVRAIISSVGNYGEVFERNLGEASPLGLERGLNRLWRDGGLLYAPPLDR